MSPSPSAGEARRDLPLSGVRVLALEQYGAGPFASLYLADMGAEVIKIEQPARPGVPGGDSSRQSGPFFVEGGDSFFFQTFNLGKKSVTIDMRKPAGRDFFRRLVPTADAVLNNLRGDQPEKLGLTYDALADLNPSVVCAHLSGYGRTGARATWPAYDYLMQAEAGFLALTGEPDSAPARMGLSVVDYLTGITTAFALTAALLGAARTGRGRDIDVSLFDVALHQLTYPAAWYLNAGAKAERRPRSGHPAVVPCETFPTSDGSIFVMCILPKFWEALCGELGVPELVHDGRFADPAARFANRDELVALLDKQFSRGTTAEWLARLQGRVPVAPVLSLPEALDSPYLAEAGMVQEIDLPHPGGYRALSSPIRVDGERAQARRGPALGEHTDELLAEAGFAADEIAALRASGAV